jgi:hypothetical protein
MDRGLFKNLSLAGKPLPEDDLANLPDDLRLAWRILRSSGYTNKSPKSSETLNLNGLLDDSPDENQTCRKLTRLKIGLDKKKPKSAGGAAQNESSSGQDILESAYLDQLLRKIR